MINYSNIDISRSSFSGIPPFSIKNTYKRPQTKLKKEDFGLIYKITKKYIPIAIDMEASI